MRTWLGWLAMCVVMGVASSATAGAVDEWQTPRVVAFQGVDKVYNYSRAFGLWGVLPRPGRPGRLLVRDGDIVAVRKLKNKKLDEPVFVAYREADGLSLDLAFDGHRLTMAGTTVGLRLDDEPKAWAWLEAASGEALAALRFVTLETEVDEPAVAALKRLAAANRHVDLAVLKADALDAVLPMFQPRRLVLGETRITGDARQALLRDQTQLETLWMELGEPDELAFVEALPKLRRLVISEWKPDLPAPFPPACKRLESLAIINSNIEDLFAIEELTGLRELHLRECQALTDIGSLAHLAQLRVLTLSVSKKASDLAAVGKLAHLEWLSVACEMRARRLGSLLRRAPRLRTLELVANEKAMDLSVLESLDRLRHLVAFAPEADLFPLHQLRGLRLLVLHVEAFDEQPQVVAALAKALPDCRMSVGQLCLGSGWLLLVVPIGVGGWLLGRRRRVGRDVCDG